MQSCFSHSDILNSYWFSTSLSLIFTITSKSSSCGLLMPNVCQKTSHMYGQTGAFSFPSTVHQSLVITYSLRKLFNFDNCHLLLPCRWHGCLLGRGRETKSQWWNADSVQPYAWTNDNQPPFPASAVDVACSCGHATSDIALVTCGPSCLTASWWAHAKGKDCIWLSVRPTLNIRDSAVKA